MRKFKENNVRNARREDEILKRESLTVISEIIHSHFVHLTTQVSTSSLCNQLKSELKNYETSRNAKFETLFQSLS